MKRFEVTLIGVNSAIPVNDRHPSSQIVNYNGSLILIDCGEGTQTRLTRYGVKRMKIEHILISHLHGDHVYGLPGLLTSFALYGRTDKIVLHGPIGIKRYIETILECSEAFLPYTLEIIEYDTLVPHEVSLMEGLRLNTFPLDHRIPTMGFRLEEDVWERNIDPQAIRNHSLSIDEIKRIKKGEDIVRSDGVIRSEACLFPKSRSRSYAYCSDTAYDIRIIPHIRDVDVLYHETTYLSDLQELATKRKHSTLGDAIRIAELSCSKRLVSGHYSSRYTDLSVFREAGLAGFDGFVLGEEGLVIEV